MKHPLIIATIWFVSLWLLFIFATLLTESLFILYLPVHWGIFLAGCAIATIAFATRSRNRLRSVSAFCLCAVGFVLFFTVGFDCGRYVLFQIRKSAYEQQLTQVKQLRHVPHELGRTESGPPELYAFYWSRGVTDNWSGVVYDPSGQVANINDVNGWDAIHAHDLSNLFGGTYYRCQKVGGGWYICWFT